MLAGLVLILFTVKLEIRKVFEIAALPTATTTSATAAECNLNVAECGFGAQGVLWRLA